METFFIQPRQSGKTSKALYEYFKDPENSFLIVKNVERVKNRLININKSLLNNIINSNQLTKRIKNKFVNTIIIDDYLFFSPKEKKELYELINKSYYKDIVIISSADKIYDKKLLNSIKNIKSSYRCIPISENVVEKKKINDLYYNFLTDPKTDIIDFNLSPSRIDSDLKKNIGEEIYNREILNKWTA